MNQWSLLTISMFSALVGGVLKKVYACRCVSGEASRHAFNMVLATASALTLLIMNRGYSASLFTLVLGVGFGIITALQQIFTLRAIENGPWAYTSVITSFSTVIPALSGMLFFSESIDVVQVIGMGLMAVCILLSTDFSENEKEKSIKWMLYCLISFFTTGFIGVMQKIHQSTVYKNELSGFLITAFVISAICSFFGLLKSKSTKAGERIGLFSPLSILIMAICGIMAAVNNQLNLFLSGVIDSAVFFPVVNGGGLVLTVISSVAIFKEKLVKRQWIGLVTGIISVILLCNPFK